MTFESDAALEKTLSANLGRVIDWVKFAEAKNAVLLTFCSAWIIAIASFLFNTKDAPAAARVAVMVAAPLFIVGAMLALASFAPRTKIAGLVAAGDPSPSAANLLFFGDLAQLQLHAAGSEMATRYAPAADRAIADGFVNDVSIQIVVNSRIASRKFKLFDWGALCVMVAFGVMFLGPPAWFLVNLGR